MTSTPDNLESRLEGYRNLRRDLERAIVSLATSVDGRRFTFQASLHDLALQAGGYVVLEGEGEPRLGQVITLETASREGPDLAVALGEELSVNSRVLLRYAEGEGVALEGDGAPFHDATARPAQPAEVEAWLERTRPPRASLAVGELVLAPASPSRSTRAASTGTRSSAANPARARRTRSGSSWSSSCSRPGCASSSSTRTATMSASAACATARAPARRATAGWTRSFPSALARRADRSSSHSRSSTPRRRRPCFGSIPSPTARSTDRSSAPWTGGSRRRSSMLAQPAATTSRRLRPPGAEPRRAEWEVWLAAPRGAVCTRLGHPSGCHVVDLGGF